MRGPWLVSPALAAELGSAALDQLDNLDPASAITCQVCGRVKPTGDVTPMAVITATTADNIPVIGLAHEQCRDRVGDHWPALLDRVGAEEDGGGDALAVLGLRAGGATPRPVLVYEPSQIPTILPDGQGVNLYVAMHLELGFTMLSGSILDAIAPLAPGWTLRTRDGNLTLWHSEIGAAYTQPLNPEVTEWLRYARGEGRVLVITGSSLNLDPAGPLPDDFAYARQRASVVAATVRVR